MFETHPPLSLGVFCKPHHASPNGQSCYAPSHSYRRADQEQGASGADLLMPPTKQARSISDVSRRPSGGQRCLRRPGC